MAPKGTHRHSNPMSWMSLAAPVGQLTKMWRGRTSTWALWRGPGSQLSSVARPACGQVRGSGKLSQAVHPGDTFEEEVESLWCSYCRGFKRGAPAREVTVPVPQRSAWHTCLSFTRTHYEPQPCSSMKTSRDKPACESRRLWLARSQTQNHRQNLGNERTPRVMAPHLQSGLWLWSASCDHGPNYGSDPNSSPKSIWVPRKPPPFLKHVFNKTQWGKVQGSRDL